MGHVQIDVHRKGHRLAQQYPLATERGVLILLDTIHHLREERYRGNVDAAVMLIDFMDAYKKADLTVSERQALYWRYERDFTLEETAKQLAMDASNVKRACQRGAAKIAQFLGETEGYANAAN